MQVLIHREGEVWVAECVPLRGCVSQGSSYEEALANIKDAIDLYLEDMRESGEEIPDLQDNARLVTV